MIVFNGHPNCPTRAWNRPIFPSFPPILSSRNPSGLTFLSLPPCVAMFVLFLPLNKPVQLEAPLCLYRTDRRSLRSYCLAVCLSLALSIWRLPASLVGLWACYPTVFLDENIICEAYWPHLFSPGSSFWLSRALWQQGPTLCPRYHIWMSSSTTSLCREVAP